MGYYTRFELTTYDCDQSKQNEIHYYMKDHCDDFYGVMSEDECKWYGHEKEMKNLSLKFPGVLFRLDGKGEEQGDVWVKYFKDGKVQICKAELVLNDEFDENKLK